jgi:hypothetical protein
MGVKDKKAKKRLERTKKAQIAKMNAALPGKIVWSSQDEWRTPGATFKRGK